MHSARSIIARPLILNLRAIITADRDLSCATTAVAIQFAFIDAFRERGIVCPRHPPACGGQPPVGAPPMDPTLRASFSK